jgi:protein CpxP
MSHLLPSFGAALLLATVPALAAADAAAGSAPQAADTPAGTPAGAASKPVRVERRIVLVDAEGAESELDPAAVLDDPQVRAEILRLRRAQGADGAMRGPGGQGAPRVMMLRRGDGTGMGPRGKDRGDPAARLQRMADELGLSPDQRKQVRDIYESARPQTEATRSQLRVERQRLRDADPGDRNHAATVAATSKRIGELTAQMMQQRGEMQRKVWQVLTPEQRAKSGTMRAEARDRRSAEAERLERRARELRGGNTPTR